MGMNYEKLTLHNINNGAAPELFEEAWSELLKDIANIQKPGDAVRAIQIELKVKPDKDRGLGAILVVVKTKLPAGDPSVGYVHFAKEGDSIASYVNNPKQDVLEFDGDEKKEEHNA